MIKQLGISLLEVILALVIVGFIIMLVIRYFDVANGNLKVTRAVNQIKKIGKASYQWLDAQRQADFGSGSSAISITKLKDAGLIVATDKKDPWGGDISVVPTSSDPSYVTITMQQIPIKACENLRQRMIGIAHRQTIVEGCTTRTYFIEL